MLSDTHCHIHESDYPLDAEDAYQRALAADVTTLLCVGTTLESSQQALTFAAAHDQTWATVGLHPHEAASFGVAMGDAWLQTEKLALERPPKLVGIGECGLDYYYHKDSDDRTLQRQLLRQHFELASVLKLPLSLHVREAFDDFWPLFDEFPHLKGVLHSFTDSRENLDKALERGLFIGVNGISTFTKDPAQQAVFAAIPLEKLLLETDAPYLTPVPLRGKVNEPAYVTHVARFHATMRGISEKALATATTHNATRLFSI